MTEFLSSGDLPGSLSAPPDTKWVVGRVEALRAAGPVMYEIFKANAEAELTELAFFESGQAVLERTLMTFRNHCDWNSHERACFGDMRLETIALKAGVSPRSIDGALNVLGGPDIQALIIQKDQRGLWGRNAPHVYKIGPGSLDEQLRAVLKAGHKLSAQVAIAIGLLGACDPDSGVCEIELSQLVSVTHLKEKTVRQIISTMIRNKRLICVGRAQFVFADEAWQRRRWPAYEGPHFAVNELPDRNSVDANLQLRGRPRNCGLATKLRPYKNSTFSPLDSFELKKATQGSVSLSARASAFADASPLAGKERVRDVGRYLARVRQACAAPTLDRDRAYELACEAVQIAIVPNALRSRASAIRALDEWLKHSVGPERFIDPREVILMELWDAAERAKCGGHTASSWGYFSKAVAKALDANPASPIGWNKPKLRETGNCVPCKGLGKLYTPEWGGLPITLERVCPVCDGTGHDPSISSKVVDIAPVPESVTEDPEAHLVARMSAAPLTSSTDVKVWRREVLAAGDDHKEGVRRLAAVIDLESLTDRLADAVRPAMSRNDAEYIRPPQSWALHKLRKALLRGADDSWLIETVSAITNEAMKARQPLSNWKIVGASVDLALDAIGSKP
jgi:hypothetical protein